MIPEQLYAFLDMFFAVKVACMGGLCIRAAVVFPYFFSLGRNRALFLFNKQFQSWTNADVSTSFWWRLFLEDWGTDIPKQLVENLFHNLSVGLLWALCFHESSCGT